MRSTIGCHPIFIFCTILIVFPLSEHFCAATESSYHLSAKRTLKILVYSPTLSWSHTQFLGRVADTLAEAGHDVTFLKFVGDLSIRDKIETSRVKRRIVVEPKNEMTEEFDITKIGMVQNAFAGSWTTLSVLNHQLVQFAPISVRSCSEMLQRKELLDQMTKEKFDVSISEMYDLCPLAMFTRIGVGTMIAANAIPLFQLTATNFGIPTFSSFVPNIFYSDPNVGTQMPFLNRMTNFYNDLYDWLYMNDYITQMQEPIVRNFFGNDFPPLKKIVRNVSFLFVNSNPFFEFPRPISNKIIYIGGIVNNEKIQKLDKETENLLNNSKGAVFLSFGSITNTSGMPVKMRQAFVRAFTRFPEFEFIWKLDHRSRDNDSALFRAAPNLHTFDWVSQSALLNHPKMRAFISHCGQNSLNEAARAGVPVLAIPLFGDQLYNSVVAKERGMSVHLDIRELNGDDAEEKLVESLGKILYDDQYRKNAQLIQRKISLTPFSPRETLLNWVQFAAEFPGDGLTELNLPRDEELNWFSYYSLDVLLFSTFILISIIWITLALLKAVWRIYTILTEDKKAKLKYQ